MNRAEQAAKAELFRAMHGGPHLLLLPNAWDAFSARIILETGFSAVATTSGGVAWALGYPDGEAAPWEEVVAATARITRAVAAPVTADIESGYGATPEAVGRAIGDIIGAGAVGVNLEDGQRSADHPLRQLCLSHRPVDPSRTDLRRRFPRASYALRVSFRQPEEGEGGSLFGNCSRTERT